MKPILGTKREDEDLSKLEKLTRNYINSGSKNAETELIEMNIEGRDFINLINNLGIETEKETVKYLNTKADYEQLTKDYDNLKKEHEIVLQRYDLLTNKIGAAIKDSLPEKIRLILNELEEK